LPHEIHSELLIQRNTVTVNGVSCEVFISPEWVEGPAHYQGFGVLLFLQNTQTQGIDIPTPTDDELEARANECIPRLREVLQSWGITEEPRLVKSWKFD
jgi:hypothetical protein